MRHKHRPGTRPTYIPRSAHDPANFVVAERISRAAASLIQEWEERLSRDVADAGSPSFSPSCSFGRQAFHTFDFGGASQLLAWEVFASLTVWGQAKITLAMLMAHQRFLCSAFSLENVELGYGRYRHVRGDVG